MYFWVPHNRFWFWALRQLHMRLKVLPQPFPLTHLQSHWVRFQCHLSHHQVACILPKLWLPVFQNRIKKEKTKQATSSDSHTYAKSKLCATLPDLDSGENGNRKETPAEVGSPELFGKEMKITQHVEGDLAESLPRKSSPFAISARLSGIWDHLHNSCDFVLGERSRPD